MNSMVKGCISGLLAFGAAWSAEAVLRAPQRKSESTPAVQLEAAPTSPAVHAEPPARPAVVPGSGCGEAPTPTEPSRPPVPRPIVATPTAIASDGAAQTDLCEDDWIRGEWVEVEASDRRIVVATSTPTPPSVPATPGIPPNAVTVTAQPRTVTVPASTSPAVLPADSSNGKLDAAKAEQALSRFAAAQESLKNFKLKMPAAEPPASVLAGSPARSATPGPAAATGSRPTAPRSIEPASMAASIPTPPTPAALAAASPVVTRENQAAARQADDAALDNLNRAAEAMQRLSRRLGGGRNR